MKCIAHAPHAVEHFQESAKLSHDSLKYQAFVGEVLAVIIGEIKSGTINRTATFVIFFFLTKYTCFVCGTCTEQSLCGNCV